MKEKTTSVSTSKFRSLKTMLFITVTCFIASNVAHSTTMPATEVNDTLLYN